jgi:SAM-dependent methyltransferase
LDKTNKSDQTFVSFKDKWEKNARLAFSETVKEGSDIFNWILNRNGFFAGEEFRQWLSDKDRILDAGCGNGRVTALLKRYASPSAEIMAIDLTAADIARENLAGLDRTSVHQGDLLGDLSDLGDFDLIYCQEVLHHTSDPKGAFLNVCHRLSEKGEIAIYVYKKKAPIREYADDYVREQISWLPYEQALEAMKAVTELGRALSELNVKVRVPNVQVLGIEAGEYDVQRLIYHFFLKCFWNASLSFQDNVAINYDWYHPQLCSRHTLEEVKSWFVEAGLRIIHTTVDYYGITVRGTKKGMVFR